MRQFDQRRFFALTAIRLPKLERPSPLQSEGRAGVASELRGFTDLGFDVQTPDFGCCGLAGSFGFDKEHDALSRQIARDRFVPGIVRGSLNGPVILDGFSRQVQAGELTNVATTSTGD
jgi:hypothetical protein